MSTHNMFSWINKVKTRNVSKGHRYPHLKNLLKLLMVDADGLMDRGYHCMPFLPFFEWLGHTELSYLEL